MLGYNGRCAEADRDSALRTRRRDCGRTPPLSVSGIRERLAMESLLQRVAVTPRAAPATGVAAVGGDNSTSLHRTAVLTRLPCTRCSLYADNSLPQCCTGATTIYLPGLDKAIQPRRRQVTVSARFGCYSWRTEGYSSPPLMVVSICATP